MMSEWREMRLGDLVTFSSGGTPSKKNPAFWNGDIPWISAKSMKDEHISTSELMISEKGLASGSKLAPAGSLLLLTRGSGLFNGIPLCIVEKPVAFNQDVKCIESKSDVSNLFIFYWLKSQEYYLKAKLDVTGIGAGKFDTRFLQELIVPVPPYTIRERIVAIADAVSKQIATNIRINDNLYAQAKAIFEQQFIDLETIPDGWKKGNLLDVANYLNGLAMQKYRPNEDEVGLPVLKIKELRQGSCDNSSELCSPNIKPEYIIHDGDVIFSWSGSLLVDIWCGGTCGLNQHLFKVTSNTYDKWFYYLWTAHHLERFIAIAADKATTMGHIKRGELAKAEVLIPSDEDYKAINSLMNPIFNLIVAKRIEARKLAELRDELLPKLMSGEIDVSEVSL